MKTLKKQKVRTVIEQVNPFKNSGLQRKHSQGQKSQLDSESDTVLTNKTKDNIRTVKT